MGLTVHFKLTAPAEFSQAQAKRFVEAMHRVALHFQREGLVEKIGPMSSDAKTLRRFALDWLVVPIPCQPNTSTGVEIEPLAGWLFCVDVGRDCEPLWLGLCRYPATVRIAGKELPTRGGSDWRLSGFAKTQYASLHGWEHFLRCHRTVVQFLAASKKLGLRVNITDEGGYWPRRSVAALRRNLDGMNRLVAATAGAIKDSGEARIGSGKVLSPIFAHREFERLEAEGAQNAGSRRLQHMAKVLGEERGRKRRSNSTSE
ncbi:MAG: hypothetical protein AUG75_18745, partial [Cyanobacteria bacterium 13_1_20CM_4_61_6]